ncbi:response regulator [Pelagicoccus mobilis]|uniref:histidine kinase n=1 Tax=Pelagicoccus mobilis TaxID=415221 RepID=A0A934S1Z9_9BACT|nr:response regulator [Pelagicoccus mobilis]MBK1879705.1 response regulator [Pelagicoccus mobilis]
MITNWSTEGEALQLDVSDNGIGIPKEKIPNVTDPFYRADYNLGDQGSSGIGLALVSGLVQVWGGHIQIESETGGPKRGTAVTINLPLNLFKGSIANPEFNSVAPEPEELNEQELQEETVSKPSILVVEDNPDVLKFLKDEISEHFEVRSAENGIEGLEKISESHPDLIVTDVMMPEMDGIEFCRKIREDNETCHIPVIILTARTADEHYIEGIETGADEYFSKPVRAELLIARIHNLLNSRQRLRDRFTEQVLVEPQSVTVVSSDKLFLERAIKTLEDNMQTEGYDVEAFANDLKMSRVTLYRKLKAITGMPTVDFIRTMRLKRAAQLLKATDLPIGEILIQAGYYDASSFSRAFKKEFDMTPTQYRYKGSESLETSPRA